MSSQTVPLLRSCVAVLLAVALALPGVASAQSDPLRIQVIEGQGAENPIETGDAVEPAVEVSDAQGRPAPGVEVTFRAPTTGPSVTFYGAARETTVVTDDSGQARATSALANTEAGLFTIAVEAGAATAEVNQSNVYQETAPTPKKKKLGPKMIGLIVGGVVVAIAALATGGDN